jgi:predicted dehydrogenase
VRVLFCGLGGIGQRHLRNLRSLAGDQLEVHAYRVRRQHHKLRDNLSIEESADLETDYGIVVHTDLAAALATRPEAVFVCNPSSLHTPVGLAAARTGAHIFMEKPVSSSMDGLIELSRIIEAKNLICHVGYQFRFHPGLIHIKNLLDQDFFGNLISVRAEIGEHLPNWHRYEDYREMYAARNDLGGGVLLSQIHEMDLIYWYFGLPETVLCRGGRLSRLELDVEDTATSLMQFDGKAGRFPLALHQDFVQAPPTRTFKIVGDRGIATIDLIANRLTVYDRHGEAQETPNLSNFQRNDLFLAQTRHFLDCIRSATKPAVDLVDGMHSLHLALAAKRSLTSGAEVSLTKERFL